MENKFSIKGKRILVIGCENWAKNIASALSHEAEIFCLGSSTNCDAYINLNDSSKWEETTSKLQQNKIEFDGMIIIGKIAELDGLITIPVKKWEDIVSQNLKIIYQSINTFSRLLVDNSSIVIFFELGSMEGFGGGRIYRAFKNESDLLLRGMANSLAYKKIRCNALRLGFIETEQVTGAGAKLHEIYSKNAKKETPFESIGTMDDILNAVIFLLSSASKFMTGNEFYVDGGLHLKT